MSLSRSCHIVAPVLVMAALAASVAHAAEPAPALVPYTVQPGDTCEKIARRVFGDPAQYVLLHKYNPQLGPMPHRLRPGTVLQLPPPPDLGPDATLTRARGTVEARKPEETTWQAAATGLGLFRAWRVGSRARASADITFRDASLLQLRENTVVVIYGATAAGARLAKSEAHLESGALRSRMGELAGGPALVVSTDDAEAQVGAGTSLVTAREDGTRVANHGGKAVKVRGRDKDGKVHGRAVSVVTGMGSKAERGHAPGPPRPLPPAPAWSEGPSAFVSDDGAVGSISASWAAAPGAQEYLVELARDDQGLDVVTRVVVPAQVARFETQGLPVGAYWLTVATVDADHFEGIPSAPRPLQLVAFGVTPAGGESAAPLAEHASVGARVVAPAGIRCTTGDAAPAATVVLMQPGQVSLRCVDAAGVALAPRAIVVAPLPVRFAAAAGGAPTLRRGQEQRLELAAPAEVAGTLTLVPGPGATVGAPEVAGGTLRFPIRVAADAPASIELRAVVGTDAGPVTVATQVARVVDSAVVAEVHAPGASAAHGGAGDPAELGLFLGVSDFEDGFDFGNGGTPTHAYLPGLRFSWPLGWLFAAEARLTFGTVDYDQGVLAGDGGHLLLGGGADVLLFLRRSGVRPFLGVGAELDGLITKAPAFAGHELRSSTVLRVGAKLLVGRGIGVRVDALDRLTSDLAGGPGVELGAYVTF